MKHRALHLTHKHRVIAVGHLTHQLTFHRTKDVVKNRQAQLTEAELDAVLDHEFYHLKARHQLRNGLVKLLSLLTSRLLTTRLMTRETELLFELAADRFAAKQRGPSATGAGLRVLLGQRTDRTSAIRLEAMSLG